MDREEWRPVVGFEGYEVSNLGSVRSWRTRRASDRGRVLVGKFDRDGYHEVCLSQGARGEFWRKVHHLVLEAFVGPRPDGFEACHANGNASDNSAWNLRWDTCEANHLDKVRHGTWGRDALGRWCRAPKGSP